MSVAATNEPVPPRRRATPRLVATLALFVLTLALFCGIVGTVLVQRADDRQELERRTALLGAVEDLRASGADFTSLDPRAIRSMERTAGLKDLRFEMEPVKGDREVQSVLDRQGRIIGWFSWELDRSLSNALSRLNPLLAAMGGLLICFAGVALWQIRRAVSDLGDSERRAWRLAHEDMLTGLPNHRKVVELIDATLAGRVPQEVVTLALIDLEGLNDVNDTLGRFFTDGCTSTIFSGQKISQLKQVMQCSRNLIAGKSFVCRRPAISLATGTASIWITSAGHTASHTPQPVHLSSWMLSIMPNS